MPKKRLFASIEISAAGYISLRWHPSLERDRLSVHKVFGEIKPPDGGVYIDEIKRYLLEIPNYGEIHVPIKRANGYGTTQLSIYTDGNKVSCSMACPGAVIQWHEEVDEPAVFRPAVPQTNVWDRINRDEDP